MRSDQPPGSTPQHLPSRARGSTLAVLYWNPGEAKHVLLRQKLSPNVILAATLFLSTQGNAVLVSAKPILRSELNKNASLAVVIFVHV